MAFQHFVSDLTVDGNAHAFLVVWNLYSLPFKQLRLFSNANFDTLFSTNHELRYVVCDDGQHVEDVCFVHACSFENGEDVAPSFLFIPLDYPSQHLLCDCLWANGLSDNDNPN